MALSKESQDYHLTPRGWVEGTFQGDALGGSKVTDPPDDRVLTVRCYDALASAYQKDSYFYGRVVWESDDSERIEALQTKFGEHPDWFGYGRMSA